MSVRPDAPELPKASKIGLGLFALYCLCYAGFMTLAVTDIAGFRTEVLGLNLAIVWGFGLIGGAFLLALIYLITDRIDEEVSA